MPIPTLRTRSLYTLTPDFYWLVSSDLVPQLEDFCATGENLDLDTGVLGEEVWPLGTPLTYIPVDTPEVITFSSTSANDTFGGTGAGLLLVETLESPINPDTGLVEDGLKRFRVVALNGTTGVTTDIEGNTITASRVQQMRVVSSGSSERNEGTISATAASSGIQCQIVIGDRGLGQSVSKNIHRTIPADRTGKLIGGFVLIERATSSPIVRTFVEVRFNGTNTWEEALSVLVDESNDTQKMLIEPIPSELPPLTDIRAISTTSANNTAVEVRFDMTLEELGFVVAVA